MSDLITTTQETFRDQCIGLYVGMLATLDTLAERARENRGQTAAEYMGVLLVVSVIIAAVATTDIGERSRQASASSRRSPAPTASGGARQRHQDTRVGHGNPGPGGFSLRVLRVRGPLAHASLGPETLAAPRGARRFTRVSAPSRQPSTRRARTRQRGQTAAEYLGVLFIVSVIIDAVATTELGHEITAPAVRTRSGHRRRAQ